MTKKEKEQFIYKVLVELQELVNIDWCGLDYQSAITKIITIIK